jgi:hypothetical protein
MELMPTVYLQTSDGYRGDWLGPILLAVGILWLATLWRILTRADLDPVTRLTWVVVVIFVPVFGMLFYWCGAPALPEPGRRRSILDGDAGLSGTPWEKNPGYTQPKK